MDEAALRRLGLAIVVEDGDQQELQLHGVLRMLGVELPTGTQAPLFGKTPSRPRRKP